MFRCCWSIKEQKQKQKKKVTKNENYNIIINISEKDMKDAAMQTPIHTYTYACINGGKAHQIININNIARIFVATFNTKRQLVTTAATTTANTPQRQHTAGGCCACFVLFAPCAASSSPSSTLWSYGECSFSSSEFCISLTDGFVVFCFYYISDILLFCSNFTHPLSGVCSCLLSLPKIVI